MKAALSTLIPTQAILLGVVVLGCATAGLITGHLSSGDWMTAVGVVGGGAAAVTGAHVGGNVANTSNPPPAPTERSLP